MARRVHFADQGETTGAESPVVVPPPTTTPPPMPRADSGRPQRSRKPPGWMKDYDMESSCVRCRSLEDTSNVGGMYGVEDDSVSAHAGRPYVHTLAYERAGQHGGEGAVGDETCHEAVETNGRHGDGTDLENTFAYIPYYQYYSYYHM